MSWLCPDCGAVMSDRDVNCVCCQSDCADEEKDEEGE
jgi:hypothetical protein